MEKTIDLANESDVDTFLASLRQSGGASIFQIGREWISQQRQQGATLQLPLRQVLNTIRKLAQKANVQGVSNLASVPIVHIVDVDAD